MNYTYYHQDRKPVGLRRYAAGQDNGEKWDADASRWSPNCCLRQACYITRDVEVTEALAEMLFPGSTT